MSKFRQIWANTHDIIIWTIVYFIAAILWFSAAWALKTWVGLTMDELVYHLGANLEGTGGGMIQAYIVKCLVPAIIVTVVAHFVLRALKCRRIVAAERGERDSRESYIRIVAYVIPLIVILITFLRFNHAVNFVGYVKGQIVGSTFVEDNYADPAKVNLEFPDEKKNLVYLYLESMETTYADTASGGAFDENFIPKLTDIALTNECFAGDSGVLNGGHALAGSTWTMGALMAQTSGLPLQIVASHNSMSAQDGFFNKMTALGDILEEQGYHQVFMLGSDVAFGGRDLYFSQHGNFEMLDYNYAKSVGWIPNDYYVFWGLEDEILLKHAKEELTKLGTESMKSGVPFNFTLLTVDTHFEDGYACHLCPDTFDSQYANVMYCSSEQVGKLVEWIQQQEWYDNTAVVLSGDHLTMDSDFCANVNTGYDRRTYTAFINPQTDNANDTMRDYSTFDLFPTTLAAMGVKIEGDRLGLGTNLFSKTKTLVEEYGISFLNAELNKKSDFIAELADIDLEAVEDAGISQDLVRMQVYIDDYNEKTGDCKLRFMKIRGVTENVKAFRVDVYPRQWGKRHTSYDVEFDEEAGGYVTDFSLKKYKYGKTRIVTTAIGGLGTEYEAIDISPVISMVLTFMEWDKNSDKWDVQITCNGQYNKHMQNYVQAIMKKNGQDSDTLEPIDAEVLAYIQEQWQESIAAEEKETGKTVVVDPPDAEGIRVLITDKKTNRLISDTYYETRHFPMRVFDVIED